MSKYGRRICFGFLSISHVAEPKRAIEMATLADSLGLDCIGIQTPSGNGVQQDAWTLLTAMGVATSCISLVHTLPIAELHSPADVARSAATLDLLTGGRIDIALSVGNASNQPGVGANKGFSEQDASTALEEAIAVMRLMWSGQESPQFSSRFHSLEGVPPGPIPSRAIGIWLEGRNPQSLAIAGQLADGWIAGAYPDIRPDELAVLSQRLDDAAQAAGRQPSDLRRIWTIRGAIGKEESSVPFQGSAKQWAEMLAQLAVEVGIDTFILAESENAEEQLELFAREVIPLTRELAELAPGASPAFGLAHAYQGAAASGATPAEEENHEVDIVDETVMESFPASDPPASNSFT